jgi:hypothetical protein
MIQCTILTLFIPCIWIELNCSFTAPTNAPLMYTITVLYRFNMFRRHLHHPHTALHQDSKLTKISIDYKSNSYYITIFLQLCKPCGFHKLRLKWHF